MLSRKLRPVPRRCSVEPFCRTVPERLTNTDPREVSGRRRVPGPRSRNR